MEDKQRPGIGVAVVIFRDGKILIGEDFTKGEVAVYGVPGGHWESGESLAEAARREVMEEAGIAIKNMKLVSIYDFYRPDKNKSYVTIGFSADYDSGELRDEGESRKNWKWIPPEEIPETTFEPDKILINRSNIDLIWKE